MTEKSLFVNLISSGLLFTVHDPPHRKPVCDAWNVSEIYSPKVGLRKSIRVNSLTHLDDPARSRRPVRTVVDPSFCFR